MSQQLIRKIRARPNSVIYMEARLIFLDSIITRTNFLGIEIV